MEGAAWSWCESHPRFRAREPQAALTTRERQVLDLVLDGHSNKESARILGIGQRTVESHRANVMKKIGARSLPELVRFAIVGSTDNEA